MKFKCVITDIVCLKLFTNTIVVISKLCKLCALRLNEKKVYFIINDNISSGGSWLWCELSQENIFQAYHVKGPKPEYNEIFLEITPDFVAKILKTAQTAKSLKIKLTNKNVPCLTFIVEQPSPTWLSRNVSHDVPVEIIPHMYWSQYKQPVMNDSHIMFFLPNIKILRNVLEKMKNMGQHVTVSASEKNVLKLFLETEMVSINIHFTDIQLADKSSIPNPKYANSKLTGDSVVKVDVRKFHMFINAAENLIPSKIICTIASHRSLYLSLIHDDIIIQYLLPTTEVV